MKNILMSLIILMVCILTVGCAKPEPSATPTPTPATTPTMTPTPLTTPSPNPKQTPVPSPTPSTTPKQTPTPEIKPETEILVEGLVFPECPRWHDGKLWFSDMHARKVMTVDMDGKTEVIVEVPGSPGGLGWLPDGRLLVVSKIDQRLLRLDPTGLTEVADLSGLAGGECNDMVIDALGRAYIGNNGAGTDMTKFWIGPAEIIMVTPEGNMSTAAMAMVFPNGSVITPDGNTMIVAESFGPCLTAFNVEPDGSLSGRRVWAKLPSGVYPDGICLDDEGAVWVANAGKKEVLRILEGGKVTRRIKVSQGTYACALGGPDGLTLFILTAETFDPDAASAKASASIEIVRVDVPGAEPPRIPTAPAEPTPGFNVRGTLEQTEIVLDSDEYHVDKRIQKGTVYFDYHGTLEGKVVKKYNMEINAGTSQISATAEGTFTGTVDGKEGTFNFTGITSGQITSIYTGVLFDKYTIISGTGELSDLHGVIEVNRIFGAKANIGLYWGTLSFGE